MAKTVDQDKILDLLGGTFGDDPKALAAILKAIRTDSKRRVEKVHKELTEKHEREIRELNTSMKVRIEGVITGLTKNFRAELAQMGQTALLEIDTGAKKVDKGIERIDKKVESFKEWVEKKQERLDKTVERHSGSIGQLLAIGGPNRSVYVAGVLPSPYYSDTNFIAGPGITLTTSTDHVARTANITITSTATGGANIDSQTVNTVQSGTNVTVDLTQLPHVFTAILEAFRNGQATQPNGNAGLPGSSWSRSGNTLTVYNADVSDVIMIQYTF